MDKADTARLIGVIVMAYPNFDRFKNSEQVETMITVWSEMFAEDNGALVGAAVKKHIATNKFPPSIAEIREIMCDIVYPNIIPPDTAWIAVSDLLYAEGEYGSDSIKELPPLIARAVESIGWHNLYELHRGSYGGNKAGLDRVAFMDLYKPMYERERQTAMLPEALKSTFDKAALKYGGEAKAMLTGAEKRRREREKTWERYLSNNNQFALLAQRKSEENEKIFDKQE